MQLRFLFAPVLAALTLWPPSSFRAQPLPVTRARPPVASYGPWKSAPIRGGGYLQQVFFAPSDARRMYVISDVGGFWRSDDGGQSWRMLHGALPADAGSYSPRALLVSPVNANHLWLATGSEWGGVSGVFVSTDGGASWKQTLAARFEGNGWYRPGGNVLAFQPGHANVLLAAPLGGGIYRSFDGGQTWKASGPDDLCPVSLVFDQTNSQRVWLCAKPWPDQKTKRADGTEVGLRGGFYRSDDAGQSWTRVRDEGPERIVQDPRDPKVLYGVKLDGLRVARSEDGGATWSDASQGLAPDGKGDARTDGTYAAIAAGPDFLLLGGHGGHFYRLNRGEATWREVVPIRIEEGDWWGAQSKGMRHFGSALGFLAVDPRDPTHWVFTDWYALYQSVDAGNSWKLSIDGIEMTVINTIAPQPGEPGVVHAGMADVGYFRTRDGGATMVQNRDVISSNIKCLAPSPAKKGRVYATGTGDWEWKANALFRSDDSGKTWTRSPLKGLPDMNEARCETVAASPVNPDEVYLSVSGPVKPNAGGVYRSLDGGQTFSWQGEGLVGAQGFFHSSYWVSGPEVAVSGDGSLVCTSDDGRKLARRGAGETQWTMVPLPAGSPNCVAADPLVPSRFYLACQDGGLWRSDDGGRSWSNVVQESVSFVAPDFGGRDRVAAVTPTGVLVSLDAGRSWRAMGEGLPYRHPRNTVCFAGEALFVGTGGNGVFWAPLSSLRGTARSLARTELGARTQANAQVASPSATLVPANAPQLGYEGRFDWSSKDGPRCAWPASSVSLRFVGTSARVRLRAGGNVRWQVEVDGQPTQKIAVRDGVESYDLAAGLPSGEHTIRLVQATEALFGTTQFEGFELSPGAHLLDVPSPARSLEVIGDSISAGYGNEARSKDEHFSPDTENAYSTYGALSARRLGAAYTCLAWSGKKMWPDNTLPELYDFILPVDKSGAWSFGKQPDVVVINLATNDFAGGVPDEKGWTATYTAFVQRVRAHYPDAMIYAAIGPMMGDWGPSNQPLTTLRRYLAQVVGDLNKRGDARVRVLDFGTQDAANGFGADWHPNVKTHSAMADHLTQTLERDLGWR